MNGSLSHVNDVLSYLPSRPLMTYAKGSVIYSGNCEALYVVTSGRVKVGVAPNGYESIIRVVPPEGLFGKRCLVENAAGARAVALDKVQLMAWKRAEIEQLVEKQPRLGLALIEELLLATLEMQDRIQVMATRKTPQRVMFSLVQLARTLGEEQPDGALKMAALTHQLISEHVGTSREIVSVEMARLQRAGVIHYTRKYIEVYCAAIEELLRQDRSTRRAPVRVVTAGVTN